MFVGCLFTELNEKMLPGIFHRREWPLFQTSDKFLKYHQLEIYRYISTVRLHYVCQVFNFKNLSKALFCKYMLKVCTVQRQVESGKNR